MSVTFAPAMLDTDLAGWALTCGCTDPQTTWATHQEAVAAFPTWSATCNDEMCAAYGPRVTPVYAVDVPYLNVSNNNGRRLLSLLDLDAFEAVGSTTAADFLSRAFLADLLMPVDKGAQVHEDRTAGGMQFVDCGRDPGYLQDRLATLTGIALWARSHGRDVTWG